MKKTVVFFFFYGAEIYPFDCDLHEGKNTLLLCLMNKSFTCYNLCMLITVSVLLDMRTGERGKPSCFHSSKRFFSLPLKLLINKYYSNPSLLHGSIFAVLQIFNRFQTHEVVIKQESIYRWENLFLYCKQFFQSIFGNFNMRIYRD